MSSPESSASDPVLASRIHAAWQVPLVQQEEFDSWAAKGHVSRRQLEYLAGFGLLAPTSHNTVPQRFRLHPEDRRIDVLGDRRYVLRESDPQGHQCRVSLGCVLANLELAAQALGWLGRADLSNAARAPLTPLEEGDAERYAPAFSIRFEPGAASREIDALALMRARKVVRAEYDRAVELSNADEQALQRIAVEHRDSPQQLELHLIRGQSELRATGKFQEQADRFFLENRPFARELGEWLLPNDDEVGARGMRGREFGFDDAFASHVHLALRQGCLLPDQLAGFAKGAKAGLESSSAVVVLSVEAHEPTAELRAGALAQRMAIELARRGYQIAFHAALAEAEWVGSMFAASVLKTRRHPLVIFRLGKPKRSADLTRPHAARPPLEDVILD